MCVVCVCDVCVCVWYVEGSSKSYGVVNHLDMNECHEKMFLPHTLLPVQDRDTL